MTRHAAIVGSTGSGKSNTVAAFLKGLTGGSFPSARIVVIDPHGEYGAALKDRARVFSIGDKTFPLIVPYWALSFDELGWFLVDRRTASVRYKMRRCEITSSNSGVRTVELSKQGK